MLLENTLVTQLAAPMCGDATLPLCVVMPRAVAKTVTHRAFAAALAAYQLIKPTYCRCWPPETRCCSPTVILPVLQPPAAPLQARISLL